MKRRIVQHGPSTLTLSLPIKWVRDHSIRKGDELEVEFRKEGLLVRGRSRLHQDVKQINLSEVEVIIPKAIGALYKYGYDEIIAHYRTPEQLEQIHETIRKGCMGYEIIDETTKTVHIKKVSEPSESEFRPLFRRIFHFIISLSKDGMAAAETHDRITYENLVRRDEHVNKLSDFCRRVINKKNVTEYRSDTALYVTVEQLEKIGDDYKIINKLLQGLDTPPQKALRVYYAQVHGLLEAMHDLFFSFSIEKSEEFYQTCQRTYEERPELRGIEEEVSLKLRDVAEKLYNLIGPTLVLHL